MSETKDIFSTLSCEWYSIIPFILSTPTPSIFEKKLKCFGQRLKLYTYSFSDIRTIVTVHHSDYTG